MTLVLAAAQGDSVVMCADTRVFVLAPGDNVARVGQPDRKLFIRSGCGIVTYGSGPPGNHVPSAIDAIPNDLASPEDTARALLARFGAVARPPQMGALVGGFQGGAAVLYRVDVAGGTVRQELPEFGRPAEVQTGGRPIPSGLTTEVALTPEETLERMLAIQRAVAGQTQEVGPPFEYVTLRPGQAPQKGRVDA